MRNFIILCIILSLAYTDIRKESIGHFGITYTIADFINKNTEFSRYDSALLAFSISFTRELVYDHSPDIGDVIGDILGAIIWEVNF